MRKEKSAIPHTTNRIYRSRKLHPGQFCAINDTLKRHQKLHRREPMMHKGLNDKQVRAYSFWHTVGVVHQANEYRHTVTIMYTCCAPGAFWGSARGGAVPLHVKASWHLPDEEPVSGLFEGAGAPRINKLFTLMVTTALLWNVF